MKLYSAQLFAQDLRQFPKIWQLVLWACNLLVAIFVSWLTPKLSLSVQQFLSRVFELNSLTEIVLLNDYLSVYMLVYWLIFFALLPILVIPAEEGYLSLFLSKPLTRRQYLFSRLLPVLFSSLILSLLFILSCAGIIQILNGQADFVIQNYLASTAICLSLGLFMALLVQRLFLWLKDSYNAVLAGFFCLLLPVLPSSLLMYRPDLFEHFPALKLYVVFPANLIWLNHEVISLAYWLVPILLMLSIALIWQTASILEHRDTP